MSKKYPGNSKKKVGKFVSRNKITILFLSLTLIAVVITMSLVKQRQETKQYAAGLGKDLYGIAAGDSMESINATDLNRYLDDYKTLGAQWMRFDFDWAKIQSGGATSYNWSYADAAVAAANARGIKVLGTIDYTPQWELSAGCTNSYQCPPQSTADYATFAATVAARYAPMGVHTWEIWNEPNYKAFWNKPDPVAYTQLLKAAYPAIKTVDTTAFVLTGGTASIGSDGIDISPIDFLTGIYQNGEPGDQLHQYERHERRAGGQVQAGQRERAGAAGRAIRTPNW